MNRIFKTLGLGLFLCLTGCPTGPVKQMCSPTTCSGCCDATGVCKTGLETSFCGTLGATCSTCLGAQTCRGGLCQLPQTSGGGTADDGGSMGGGNTGGGSAGGGNAGGGGSTGGGSGQMCGSCSGDTLVCDQSSNFCVQCLTNAHCSGTKPACDTFSKRCVECTSNVHCSGATPLCDTRSNQCSVCTATQGCSGATPACDSSVPGGQCVGCTSNANCGGATPVCDSTIKQCVACTTGQGCAGTAPVCDTSISGGRCVGCLANSHCSGTTPVCNTTTRQCIQCGQNSDCSGATPACNANGLCVACTATAGCSGNTSVCDTSVTGGQCVQCLNSTMCATNTPSTPVCDVVSRTCQRCTANAGCSGATPTCDTTVTGGQCVQCLTSATCATNSPSTPVCNPTTKTCLRCSATEGCSGTTPACDTSVSGGQCVACLSNANCSGATPTCNTATKQCVRCTATSGCSGTTPACDTSVSGGQCVACLSNANCSSPTTQCLASTHTCVECTSNATCSSGVCDTANTHACVGCLSNANCSNPTPICSGALQCGGCSSSTQCGSGKICSGGSCLVSPETCALAQTLTISGTMLNFSVDTAGAANDSSGSCGGTTGGELVYRINLPSAKDITIGVAGQAGQNVDPVVYLRRAVCATGASAGCADNTGSNGTETITAHNVSGDLFLFIDTFGTAGGATDVGIVLNNPTLPPANDTCAGAVPLVFSNFTASGAGTIVAATNGTLSTDGSPTCGGNARAEGRDVVYSFTLTQPQDLNIAVQSSGSPSFTPVFYVRSLSNCSNNTAVTELACASGSPAAKRVYGLPAGDYALIVDSTSSLEGTFTVGMTALPPTSAPPNDSCAAPTALVFDVNNRATASGTMILATNNNLAADVAPTCNTAAKTIGRDVIYSLNLPTTENVNVQVTPQAGSQLRPVVYLRRLTDCANSASGAELGCQAGTTGGAVVNKSFSNLAAGDYVLWVDSQEALDATFDLVVTRAPPPPNDLCTAPTVLAFTNSASTTFGSTTAAAANYGGPATCASNSSSLSPDIVYSFTTNSTTQVAVAVTPTDGAFIPVVYSGLTCPSTSGSCAVHASNTDVDAPVGFLMTPSTSTANLLFVDGNQSSGTFRLDVRGGSPPNEQCSTAQPLLLTTVNTDNSIVETTALASNEYGTGGTQVTAMCGTTGSRFSGKDLVYSFTAPATASYTITVTPDGSLDPSIALLDSACNTTTCLNNVDMGATGDTETLTFSATQGTTYLIVVDGYGTTPGFFKLTIR